MNEEQYKKYIKSLNMLSTIIVSFATSILVVPPFFTEEGVTIDIPFLFHYHFKGLYKGLYFDNIYFTLLFLYFSVIMLAGPFFVPTLNRWLIRLSVGVGSWYMAGLAYEISNFTVNEEVINKGNDLTTYNRYLVAFMIFISFIITVETWIKLKKFK